MVEINAIISSYIEIEDIPLGISETSRRFDISAIDFDLLRREFAQVKKKNLVFKFKSLKVNKSIKNLVIKKCQTIVIIEVVFWVKALLSV